jgi:tRNA threonylcarbamoyl adenosine modification protein (Sua5/YciO/YrdC/YwlC family)
LITFEIKIRMLLEINPKNPDARKIAQVVKALEKGGVIIYPTDSVYGLGCDIFNQKAVARICQIRKIDPEKANLTFICKDIQQLSKYVHQINNQLFRLLKNNVPGAFTFILNANKEVPRHFKNKRKTIGVRVPNNPIALSILEELGRPILSISLKTDDEEEEFVVNPSLLHDDFQKRVDIVIDGGEGNDEPSTVVDCTTDDIEIIREGKGVLK